MRAHPKQMRDLKNIGPTILWVLCLLSVVFPLHAENDPDTYQLVPQDEAERDQSLLAFRARLIQVVEFKEPERLVEMLDPKINNGLNIKSGPREFVKLWHPESIDSEVWKVISPILRLGGGFVRSENGVMFCAPYVFVNFPAKLDISDHGVIIQGDVKLMQRPTTASTIVTNLAYDIVQVDDWSNVDDESGTEKFPWIKVSTMDDKEGYVQKIFIRSPADYSACFIQRKNKGWKLNSLLSRD